MTYVRMADAAFAANIPPGFDIVAGYYGGPNAYHIWSDPDWKRFPGFKLPIWVGGQDGAGEGRQAIVALKALGVPSGSRTVLDLETRVDKTYTAEFGKVLRLSGYLVEVYGSASTVFQNPPLNGYWAASYGITTAELDTLMAHPGVRGVQFASNPLYDSSLVKSWTEGEMWRG